jgi:hypothetical protein
LALVALKSIPGKACCKVIFSKRVTDKICSKV